MTVCTTNIALGYFRPETLLAALSAKGHSGYGIAFATFRTSVVKFKHHNIGFATINTGM